MPLSAVRCGARRGAARRRRGGRAGRGGRHRRRLRTRASVTLERLGRPSQLGLVSARLSPDAVVVSPPGTIITAITHTHMHRIVNRFSQIYRESEPVIDASGAPSWLYISLHATFARTSDNCATWLASGRSCTKS